MNAEPVQRWRWRSLAACIACWLSSQPAHAYRNPARFTAPAEDGGGGGKFFTGSRAEGYTCSVCHSAGEAVVTPITGLPIDGYEPGQTYAVTIDWPDEMRSVALNVELTDYDGNSFGELLAVDPGTVSPADLCKGEELATGQELSSPTSSRRVMTVAECGQAQTTFLWRAPPTTTRGYFATSILFSNGDSKLGGDRVVDVSRAFGPVAAAAPDAATFEGGCSVVPLQRGTQWPWLGVACMLLVRKRRRKL